MHETTQTQKYTSANIGIASYGVRAPSPDFQLFNFSGHFRAAQPLDIRLPVVAYPVKIYRPVALTLFTA